MPAARQLAQQLDGAAPARQRQLLGDTVLRCAVQHAMRQLHLGDDYGLPLPQCAILFQAAGEHLRAGLPGGPLTAHLPPVARLHAEGRLQDEDPYIWHAWQDGTPYACAFLAVMEDNYGAPLVTPTPHERALLRRGLRLLETLLPRLTASALSHVQLIALFPKLGTWRGKASSSQFRVNGSLFLNQELIGNPWWLAEHLLHEALHQKLYDFRHGHSLLAADYARARTAPGSVRCGMRPMRTAINTGMPTARWPPSMSTSTWRCCVCLQKGRKRRWRPCTVPSAST